MTKPFVAALLAATTLSACASVPTTEAAAPAFASAPLPASTQSDLPRNASPLHYSITIHPDAEAMTFSGTTAVDLEVFEQSSAITLHAADIKIVSAGLYGSDGQFVPLTASPDEAAQTVRLATEQGIAPGKYRLDMFYTGKINTQAFGLFALDYPDKVTGEEVRGLFTQFEAPDARRFSPMFDEPSYKATFDLTAIVPEDQMAISNMPIASEKSLGNGTKQVTFGTTPKMSSYLLFFALGDFERISKMSESGTEVGIVAPKGSGDQGRYALDSLAELVPYFNDYFGVDYPLPKLDNVAGPGTSQFFGAMENWGAIFTFEKILLDDPRNTSAAARQYIYQVQAHEVAHQWFGDIVTMAWWDDLWLNEGFASWMETKATDHFNPSWDALSGRIGGREAAMNLDSFQTTHPVVQEIASVDQLASAFDTIAYQKGEAVISMLEAYAGEDTWRTGLRSYMRNNQYSNARSDDLWQAMQAAGATGLTTIATDFTTQPGVPLVQVTRAECVGGDTQLGLVQKEFSADRREEALANPQHWTVPMLVRIGNSAGERHLLDGSADLTVQGCGPVVVNGGQLGYFRTLYEPEALDTIVEGFAGLDPLDQYGLMRDNLALSYNGNQPMAEGIDVLAAVPTDAGGVLAGSSLLRWQELYGLLEDDAARTKLAARIEAQWMPRLEALGFEPVPSEPVLDSNLRARLITVLGSMGSEKIVAEAGSRFAALEGDPTALDGPLKTTWSGIVASNTTKAQWDLIRKLAANSKSAVERTSYYSALGSAYDEDLARAALALSLTDEPGATTSAEIISRVSKVHPEMAWEFVKQHRAQVDGMLDSSGAPGFYSSLFSSANSPAMLAEAEAFRATLPVSQRAAIDRAIAQMQSRMASTPRQRAGVMEWLAAQD